MQDQGVQFEAIKRHIANKFGSFDDLDAQWQSVLALHLNRLDNSAKQGKLVK
jgi:hypothetical protein